MFLKIYTKFRKNRTKFLKYIELVVYPLQSHIVLLHRNIMHSGYFLNIFPGSFFFFRSFEHQVEELTTVIFIRHAIVVNGSRSSIYNRRVNPWCRTADSSPENFVSLLLPFNTIGSEVGITQGTVLVTLNSSSCGS